MQEKALRTIESLAGEFWDNAVFTWQHKDEDPDWIVIGSNIVGVYTARKASDDILEDLESEDEEEAIIEWPNVREEDEDLEDE